jgi:hypothetical protein
MKRKTDIEIMNEQCNELSNMTMYKAFEYMHKHNLQYFMAPWEWDKTYTEHCSRCGSDTVREKTVGNKVFQLTQCVSAVRYYIVVQ